jgi:DNA-binding NarL/FixJ family response regulator
VTSPIRLLVADDHRIVLGGLLEVFRLEPDIEVVASCVNGREALEKIRQLVPDIALLDVSMPELDGVSVARQVKSENLPVRIILLSAVIDEAQAVEVVRIGVEGIVLKEMPPNLLLECIRKVHAGQQWIEKNSLRRAMEGMIGRQALLEQSPLTKRELEMIRMVGEGFRSREIAEKLFISEGTVKFHLHNIYEKLGVRGRVELLNFAREKKLI